MGLCVTLKHHKDAVVIEGLIVVRVGKRCGLNQTQVVIEAPPEVKIQRVADEWDNDRARAEYHERVKRQSEVGV